MAAWKLLKFLSHATDTRISVCTTRNRLRSARLIFELWNLNFNIDHFVFFLMKKMGIFSECFVENIHICKTLHEFYFKLGFCQY